MNIELTQDYFSVFGLKSSYELDSENLLNTYRRLQNVVHPDRYAQAGDRVRREILQKSAYLNEAYQTLKSPLLRGFYLLKLNGYEVESQRSQMDIGFLTEQMEIRERLAEIKSQKGGLTQLNAFAEDLNNRMSVLYQTIKQSFQQKEFERAKEGLLKQQFLNKIAEECRELKLMFYEEEC